MLTRCSCMPGRARVADSSQIATRLALAALLLLGGSGVAAGATLDVPDDYETIAEACNAAVSGDIVLVEPGPHLGPVPIPPGVVVRSLAGPEVTIIEFSSVSGGPVTFQVGSETAVLEGFTVAMGDFPSIAVRSFNPETIIRNNLFEGGAFNNAVGFQLEAGGLIEENGLAGNQFTGIRLIAGTLTLLRNYFSLECAVRGSHNVLVWAEDAVDSVMLEHNTFIPESDPLMIVRDGTSVTIKNNILAAFHLICQGDAANYEVTYNMLAKFSIDGDCTLGVGNILGQLPTFCDDVGCDLRLVPGSPGADDGEGGVPMGAFDVGCEPIVAVNAAGGWSVPPSIRLATPNPLTRSTVNLVVTMPLSETLELAVFDVRGAAVGREIAQLDAGTTEVRFTLGERVPSGVYFLRAATPSWQRTTRVSVVR